jgi:hypothetical protein
MNFIVRIRNQSAVDAHKIRVQAIVSGNLKVVNVTPFSRDVQQRIFAADDIRTVINFPLIEQLPASTASSLMAVMVIRVKAVKPGGRASCRVQITHRDVDGDYLERTAFVPISPNDGRGTDPGRSRELPAPASLPSPTPTPSVPAVAPIASEPAVPPASEAQPTESSPIDPPATQPADAPTTPTPGNEPTPTPKIPSEAVQLSGSPVVIGRLPGVGLWLPSPHEDSQPWP